MSFLPNSMVCLFCTCNCSSCIPCFWAHVKYFYGLLNDIIIHRSRSPKLGVNNRSLFPKYYSSYCNGKPPAGATLVRQGIVIPALFGAHLHEPSVTTGLDNLWRCLVGPALATYFQTATFPGACSTLLSAQHYAVPASLNQSVAPPRLRVVSALQPSFQEQKPTEAPRSHKSSWKIFIQQAPDKWHLSRATLAFWMDN